MPAQSTPPQSRYLNASRSSCVIAVRIPKGRGQDAPVFHFGLRPTNGY
jgi:hypothetical protein